nr:ribonuclease H-like domain-containing protein [Tanacetum cinerariifolium]
MNLRLKGVGVTSTRESSTSRVTPKAQTPLDREMDKISGGVVGSRISKGNVRKADGFWIEVLHYMHDKTKQPGRRTYDMVNGKWKTVRLNVAQFCGVHANVMRRAHASGTRDEDYFGTTLLDYQVEHEIPYTLRHCWESYVPADSNSFISVDTKRELGYVNLTGENDWGFGDSKLSVFNSNSEDWEGKPIYNRYSVPTASDSCVENARPNNVVNDSDDFTSRTSTSGSEEQVDNVCSPQEDLSSSTSLGFDVQSSDSMYCNFHNHNGKGILGKRPSENHVNTSYKRSFPIPADKSFGSRAYTPYYPQSKHFPTSHNSYYSMHLANGTFGGTAVKPSAGWPWTKQNYFYSQGSKINDGSKSKSRLHTCGPQGRSKSFIAWISKTMSDIDFLINSVHEGDAPEQKVTPPPQITTVTSLSAKFPYLKKDEHMGDFYHMIDAKQIWSAIKARFGGNAESTRMRRSLLKHQFEEYKASEEEGLDGGYDKMQKILSKMNILKIKPDQKDINIKFLRGLPPSWANIAQIIKVKGGLEYMSLDDLYNKLKCL